MKELGTQAPDFQMKDVKVGTGAQVGVDIGAGPGVGITLVTGVAHGFSDTDSARVYFRTGLAF